MTTFAGTLPPLSRLTLGTGGITDPANPEHLRVARAGMEAGVWFHVADYGGGVYRVLQQAFREDPAHVPPCLFKLDGTSPAGFRASLEDALARTGKTHIEVGQVCGNPVDDTLEPLAAQLQRARDEGLVGCYIMDVIYQYSPKVLPAVDADLFAGYIFYLNVMERELSDAAYDRLIARGTPMLAMRTFGGRDGGNYLQEAGSPKHAALEPWFQAAGCDSRAAFCVHAALSLPGVATTIGSTGTLAHLQAMLDAAATFRPLAAPVVDGILHLHRTWNAGRG